MKAERIVWELDPLVQEAEAEQDQLNAMIQEVGDALTGIARRYHPRLGELDSAGLRALGELVSRTSCRFTMDLDGIIGRAEQVR